MLDLALQIFEPAVMLSILAAVAVFATIVTIAMPLLQRDELSVRMRSVVVEREKLRSRERSRLGIEGKKTQRASLRQDTTGIVRSLVERLNLRAALADEGTFANLKMAGYRKQSHIYVFLFFRLVLPFVMLAAGAVYVFWILNLDRPFMMKMSIVLGARRRARAR